MSEVLDDQIKAASTEIAEYSKTESALIELRNRLANVSIPEDAPQAPDELPISLIEPEQAVNTIDRPPYEPSDADCMWEAIKAVASAFDMTTEQATTRLAAVQWTI